MSPPPFWTRSADLNRSGCWPYESKLTSSYVQQRGIRVLGRWALDDPRGTEGQVLVAPGVPCRDGKQHDLALMADMSNRIYAFALDEMSPTPIWKQTVGSPIVVTKNEDMWGINPRWGILSTMVLDYVHLVLYAVSYSSLTGKIADAHYYFHAIDVRDGAQVAAPILLDDATYRGKRLGSAPRKQRAALTLYNSTVFVPFGTFAESSSANLGWVVAVDVSGVPRIDAAWTTGVKYPGAGIWMAGEGLSVSDRGFLYGVTGNGGFSPATGDFGQCVFKLAHAPGSLSCVDWWSPYSDADRAGEDPTKPMPGAELEEVMDYDEAEATNAANVTPLVRGATSNQHKVGDQDLGSGGALPIPASYSGFSTDAIIVAGKDGIAYVCNEENLGKTQPADFLPENVRGNFAKLLSFPYGFTFDGSSVNLMPTSSSYLPILPNGKTAHVHGTPVRYTSPDHGLMIFVQGENGPVRAFTFGSDYELKYLASGGEIASDGVPPPGGMPGGMLSLSCNGEKTNTGVLWSSMPLNGDANKFVVQGRLVAYGANWDNQGQLIKLWDSAQWNVVFKHNKFNKPTIWGGYVLLPDYGGGVTILG